MSMSSRRALLRIGLLTIIQVVLSGSAIAAEENDDLDRWLPAVGLVVGLEIHKTDAETQTGPLNQPARSTEKSPLRPPSSGDTNATGVAVGAEFELMAPSFTHSHGAPRMFARGSVDWNLTPDTRPSSEGARGPIEVPRNAQGLPPNFFQAENVLGQGTNTKVEYDDFEYRAGLGVAFATEFRDRKIRIKPSVEYIQKTLEATGGVTRVVQLPGTPLVIDRLDPTTVRIEQVDLKNTRTLYGVGPGIEIEMQARREGSLSVELFAGGKFYYYVGDLTDDLRGTTSAGELVEIRFDYDEWNYRFDTGIRFRWHPQ